MLTPKVRLSVKQNIIGGRTPPQAHISVAFKIDPGSASVRQVIIIAPPDFEFPMNCGSMCEMWNTIPAGSGRVRKSVKIEHPQGYALTAAILDDITIHTITPAQTPDPDGGAQSGVESSPPWFVQTRAGSPSGGYEITGWDKYAGFPIRQMDGTKLMYPNRRGLQGAYFAFSFQASIDDGRVIRVIPPVLYEVYCSLMPNSGAPALKPLNLPGETPGCIDSPLTLTLTAPLLKGSYSFILGGDVPNQEPATSAGILKFALIIEDADANVLDANYDLPIKSPFPNPTPMVADATLNWDRIPRPEEKVVVHVGLTFTEVTRG